MLKTSIRTGTLLATALFYLILGLLCLVSPRGIVMILYYFLSYGFMAMSLVIAISARFSIPVTQQRRIRYIEALAVLLIGVWVSASPYDILLMIPYMIGLWGFIVVLIRAIDWYVFFHDKLIGTVRIAIEIVVLLVFSILIFLQPLVQTKYIIYLLGGYFIVYGNAYLQDFLGQLFPRRFTRRRKIGLPVFMNVLLPQRLVLTINKKLKDEPSQQDFLSVNHTNETCDMEIFIHMGTGGFDSVGHVDVAFGDIVLSYGNHDPHSTWLHGGVGDGVIYFAEKSSYLHMSVKQRGRSVASFGIKLSNIEKQRVKQQLISLAERFEPWLSDYDKAKRDSGNVEECQNYASNLSRYVEPKFYKFHHGKFKTYFVMTTNCVLLAETLLGKSSIDLISMNGIITPGTYYDYLNSEFQIQHSLVISRQFHTEQNIEEVQPNLECKQQINVIIDPIVFIDDFIFPGME